MDVQVGSGVVQVEGEGLAAGGELGMGVDGGVGGPPVVGPEGVGGTETDHVGNALTVLAKNVVDLGGKGGGMGDGGGGTRFRGLFDTRCLV